MMNYVLINRKQNVYTETDRDMFTNEMKINNVK